MFRRISKTAASNGFTTKKVAIFCTLASAAALATVSGACSAKSDGFGGGGSSSGGSGGGTTSSSGATSSGGSGGGGGATPCGTTIACSNPSLDVSFSPMYSAFVTDSNAQTFQIPAIVKGAAAGEAITWGASDPSAVACQTDTTTGGVTITVLKPETVTITAQTSAGCGQSTLNVTSATNAEWQAGNKRYNNHVPIYGGCIGLNKAYPDGGAAACPTEGPACVDCHGKSPKNQFFNGVLHTPEQAGGFSDAQLIGIFTQGIVPDGGYFNSSIVSPLSFSVFHRWADIQGADQESMVVYLRSLEPVAQGSSDFGGSDDGGATSEDAGTIEATSPTCGSTTCVSGEVCCVQASDKTDAGLVGSCGPAAACTGFALACTYTSDCPTGQYCCGNLGGSPATASCQDSCSATEDQLCEKVGECPSGDACRAYAYGDGIKVCIEKAAAADDGGKAAGKKDAGAGTGTDDAG